tara:strand:- start:762 stop:1007 length:246 start_codon:yes stop_codon:yes gene_type:complete
LGLITRTEKEKVMAGVPCPSCKVPIGLTLELIIRNPIMVCPHCKTVMNFEPPNDEIKEKMKKGLAEIEKIKNKYKDIVKFG